MNWFFVDWNGWHAPITLASAAIAVAASFMPGLALVVCIYLAVADLGFGIWATLDSHIAGLLYLPSSGDAILHFLTAAVFGGVAAVQLHRNRAAVRLA